MNIVLVGIQGSGKGTMARLIQEKYSYNLFEMGQKLRNFSELGLPESLDVKKCITEGKLVPMDLIGKILTHYLSSHKDNFSIFDGIPRNLAQKELIDIIVKEYVVFFLDLNKEEAINRLAGRRIDPETGESFASSFTSEINPKTGNKLVTRDDDKPEFVKNRVNVFYENTMPLLAAWAHDGVKVYHIDANKNIEEEFAQIDYIIGNEFYTSV